MKYLSSNQSFIHAIGKLFEKCIEYEMFSSIWKKKKTAILIRLHKKGSIYLKINYQLVILTCTGFEKLIKNHVRFYRRWYKFWSTRTIVYQYTLIS